ncbi:uncharacterized protein LOC111490456 [Cucurbita maxima]|uniref:Uncharacterized protein LOC111490456 n=1 Tax=Cucurbita maxima TaxID=3661 RepID=A0A6J1K2H4_CUCMA|nr:uncharacterized protein LOC111490456 [Cucurbita maxima]
MCSMMQITATQNSLCPNKSLCLVSKSSYPSFLASQTRSAFVNPSANTSYLKKGLPVLKYDHRRVGLKHRYTPIASLFGSKGKDNGDGGSPWKAFDKVVENFKKGRSVEDILRQQIENKDFYDGGDGGRTPPGGGGGSSGGDSSSESEDHNILGILEETMHVVLATIGLVLVYIYIIEGQELVLLAKDYIKYLFGADRSARLKSAMYSWGKFYKRRTRKKQKPDEYWLEKAILNTPTWWDHPDKYRYAIMEYLESQRQQESPAASSSSSSSSSSSYDDEEYEESNSDDEQF